MEGSVYIKRLRYESADSFLKALNYGGELYDTLSNSFIYRGHYSEKYKLVPYALRNGVMDDFTPGIGFEDKKVFYCASKLLISQIWGEYQLLQRFYSLCDENTLKVPECARLRDSVVKSYDLISLFGEEDWLPKDLWDVAALAQHYGIPTRLLDWTTNIKTALYFAIVDYIKPISIAKHLERHEQQLLNPGKIEDEYCEIWALDTKILVARENRLPLIIIRPPYNGNPNLAAQEGVFTLWPVPKPVRLGKKIEFEKTWIDKTPLDVLLVNKLADLKVEEQPFIYRISFSRNAAVDLYAYLERERHTAAKLFPGYSGVAQSIREAFMFKDIEIRRRKRADKKLTV